jgi:hypothetical protein
MPTDKQIKAVNEMVGNGGKAQPAMRKAGYSENTINTPQKLTESKGFKQLCDECGLTEELIVGSLVADIKSKPQNRLGELGLGAKIKGLVTDKSENTSTIRIVESSKEGIDKYKLYEINRSASTDIK